MTNPPPTVADFSCHVLPGAAFLVISGANVGDPLLSLDDLCVGDIYRLEPNVRALQLAVVDSASAGGRVLAPGTSAQSIANGGEFGTPGATLHLTARLTFLAPEGHKVDLLLLELSTPHGSDFAALPLEPIEPGPGHTLIGIDPHPAAVRLADVTSLALARGTHITMADGRQSAVETLRAGDVLLTRDHGPQPLRHVMHRTLRAVGPFAPVVIPKGTFGNAQDLILGQQQRVFIYQRGEDKVTETAEILVKAAHLVDGSSIFLRPGGFTDFFSLVLDQHEVIYAECVPVESLEVNSATLPALPEDLAREVGDELPNLNHRPHIGTKADKAAARAAHARLRAARRRRP